MSETGTAERRKDLSESQRALQALIAAMALGLVMIAVYSVGLGAKFTTTLSVGILLAGMSLLTGGTLGFLFGIPRTLQYENELQSEAPELPLSQRPSGRRIDYRANTNLEQISDWLTKILVGVGLTQVNQIKGGMEELTRFAANGLGGTEHQLFAFTLLSYYLVLGFLFGYLWTRLFLAGALRIADQAVIGELKAEVQKVTEKAETTERKLEELKKQAEIDAAALNLAYGQLNPIPESPEASQEALDKAIAAASRPIKVQIFNQAWEMRAQNWRDAESKVKMARTIPLFRALTHCDTEAQFHKNHGQLGFALKDKKPPDWTEAEVELTKAIEIRGPWEIHGWVFYEFNRAMCRIKLDPNFSQDLKSEPDHRAKVMKDLSVAMKVPQMRKMIRDDATFARWMTSNGVTEKELRQTD